MTLLKLNAHGPSAPVPHFWRSVGFTPAKLLLTRHMEVSLDQVGRLPNQPIEFVRIHDLLKLVEAKDVYTNAPVYTWDDLDRGLDLLVRNRLRPFFEIMGNPSDAFQDFTKAETVRAFADFVAALARHVIDRYGRQEVLHWYFETWNEPDTHWCHLKGTEFLNYVDACSTGLREADPDLRFGGPGTAYHLSGTLRDFLAHCHTGTNSLTGETGIPLAFVSVHEKGAPPTLEDIHPDTDDVIRRTRAVADYLAEHHPPFAQLPLMNNECDPHVGWSDHHGWRGRPYYAAWVANAIIRHQHELRGGPAPLPFELLSSDSAFLGEWGQRTLQTTFGKKEDREAGRFELVKKPLLNLFSMLGWLHRKSAGVTIPPDAPDDLQVLATRDGQETAILLSRHIDPFLTDGSRDIFIDVDPALNPDHRDMIVARLRLSEEDAHPFTVWEAYARQYRHFPDKHPEIFAAMRAVEDPALVALEQHAPPPGGSLRVRVSLPRPGVELLVIRPVTDAVPPAPKDLVLDGVPAFGDRPVRRLRWAVDEPARVLFDVQARFGCGTWVRLNARPLMDRTFLLDDRGTGFRHRFDGKTIVRVVSRSLEGTVSEPAEIAWS